MILGIVTKKGKNMDTSNLKKQDKGITLIALVVSIIVLIILAGVSISMLTGENGIMGRANLAKTSTEFANYKEELEQWKMSRSMEDVGFSDDTLSAGKNNLSYGGEKKDGNIKTIIPDLKDDYLDEIEVIKGKLVLRTTDNSKINSAKIANVSVNPYEIKDGELMSAGENLDLVSGDGSLTIPENVTKIGSGSFSGVDGLKTVIIPGTVKVIGDNAFSYNTTLEKVIIQDGVETIGREAFRGCTQLESIEMTDSVMNIYDNAFTSDSNLQNVRLSNNITKISSGLFQECFNLLQITIPENVTSIEDLSFTACRKLDKVYIPKNVSTISSGAFRGCNNLNTVTIDKENQNFTIEDNIVYKIGETSKSLLISLASNTNRTEITIPEGVTTLEVGALGYFKKVEILNLPSTLSYIQGWAFDGCGDTLKTITIPESNNTFKVVDNMILSKNGEILIKASMDRTEITIPSVVKTIGAASITGTKIKKVTIGDNVENIESQSFRSGTYNMTEVVIGKKVKNISSQFRLESDFWNVTLTIDSENPNYIVEGNFILSKDRKTLISPINKASNVVVPEGVEIIENLAQMEAETIKLPNTIRKIKKIINNYSLKEISIPSSCTTIDKEAFSGCIALETINIQNKENSISGAPWGATKGLKVVKWNG